MVRIITDTTAGLPMTVAQRYGITVIPQIVNFGGVSFREGIDIDNATFMQKLRTSRELPQTAAPPPEFFTEVFQRFVPTGETIFCIHPSAEVSGTVRSATLAAAEFPRADIRVVDTRLVGCPLASLVELAAQLAEAGQSSDAIEARLCALIPRARLYFVVATLEYLVKGGRIGGAAGLVGTLLQIKPILALRDGRVEPYERARTHRRALERLKELVIAQAPCDGSSRPAVMHAAAPDEARALADELAAALHVERVPILDVPPAIVTHSGPGALGVSFFVAGEG